MPEESTEAGYGSYRFVVGGAAWFLQFCMGMSFFSVAPLFPLIMDSYGIERATVSLLVGAGALVMAALLVPASVVAARLGPRRAIAVAGILISAVSLAPFASSFPLLLATRVAFACGAALLLSALPLVVLRWFPAREFPMINGLNVVSQSLGVTVSMLTAAAVADAIGWRGALLVFGLATASATVTWAVLIRERANGPAVPPPSLPSLASLRATLGHRVTLLLGLGLLGGIAANVSYSSWLPTFYNEEFGYSLQRAGIVASVLAVFGIAGALLGSILPFRTGVRKPYLLAAGAIFPPAAFGCFMVDNPLILFPAAAVFGIASWLYFPVAFTIPLEVRGVKQEDAATMVATVLSLGNFSGFFAPLLVGVLRDSTGSFVLGLTICGLSPLALVISGLFLPETGPRGSHPALEASRVPSETAA